MADIKSLIDKFNIFRTKDSILNDVAKDNGQITIDIKQPFSDDIDSNNSLKTKLETNIKDKLFNTEINNVGSNIFDEKIKPFDKGYNVSNTPDTDTKTPIDTTPIKPDTPTIEKNTADATNIQQEKIQQPKITTPKPKQTQQYKTITEQQNTKLTNDSLGNPMPIDFDERKGTSYSGVGEQQIDEIFNRLDTPEKFDMFMQSVSEAYDQLKSANLNDKENIIFLPYSYEHENGNMNGIRLTFGGRQKEWAEKQLKILETAINDKQNEEWLSNLELPQPKTTMDKITSNPWLQLFSFMQPPTNGMDPESKRILESGQKENRLNAIKWGLIENIKECKDILDKYYKDKSQVGIALSQKNIAETINNVIFPQIDLVKQSEIASIISKYKKNPKSLTPIENEIVKYYSDYVNALSVVANKTSTGYETTKAIETSLPFMADFLRFNLVGSATRGGTRAAMKIGGKGLARQIAKDTPKTIGARAFKLGEDILTAAGHTSVSPLTFTNMLEDYSQTMETNGQYTKNDLRRGVIEAFTENFSERMFGALKGILPKSNNAFVNSLFGNNPVIKSMQKHMNVGGLFEETGEEYAGAFVNTMFGFALGDEKLASSFKEQLNNSVPTILSIGITVGLPQAIGMGIDFREIKKMNTRFNVAEDNLKQYFNKENSYLDINRYSDALKSLYINLNNAKNEEDKTEIKGKIAELNKTAANLAMEKGDSNGFNLISEYSIAAQNSFYVTNKAMSELKNMSEEDRTKLSDNAINKLKNDFTNNLNWSLISRAAAKNITDQNGKQHPTCFLYTDNGVTYVLNGQKDNMFYFVDVNGNTISKSADELRNNENLSVLHLNNLLSSFSNKELEDINSKFIDIAQYNAGYRYKVNDNGEIRYYTDNKDLIKSNIPYEQINRDKIESHLVGLYDLVRIDNITNAVEDMANAFAEPAAEQTSTEQTSTEQQKPAQEPAQEQPSEEPIQEQPQEQTTQEPAQEQPIQEQTTEEQETTEQEPIQPAQQQIEPAQEQIEPAQEEDDSTALNEQENTESQSNEPTTNELDKKSDISVKEQVQASEAEVSAFDRVKNIIIATAQRKERDINGFAHLLRSLSDEELNEALEFVNTKKSRSKIDKINIGELRSHIYYELEERDLSKNLEEAENRGYEYSLKSFENLPADFDYAGYIINHELLAENYEKSGYKGMAAFQRGLIRAVKKLQVQAAEAENRIAQNKQANTESQGKKPNEVKLMNAVEKLHNKAVAIPGYTVFEYRPEYYTDGSGALVFGNKRSASVMPIDDIKTETIADEIKFSVLSPDKRKQYKAASKIRMTSDYAEYLMKFEGYSRADANMIAMRAGKELQFIIKDAKNRLVYDMFLRDVFIPLFEEVLGKEELMNNPIVKNYYDGVFDEVKQHKADAEMHRQFAMTAETAQETAQEQPIQEQQPAQEEDDSTALNGVPDIVDDTPQDARTRGFRRVNGYKIDRQKPLQAVNGKEISVRFSNDVIANGHVAVIDAEQLQPSHIQGVRNPLHFIDEAQPKERNDEASIVSAQRIAKNIRPEEITSSVTAYTGAPIINARGETIQGNNRSDALRLMWSQNKDQAEKYKQYLIDHAQEFGLNAEDIAAMERPILVNMIDVSDEDAIALGQYVAQDTESGGLERIKPKNAVQKMGADMRTFANLLLSSNDDEISFAGLIDKNGVDVLNWLGQKGYITPTQYKSAFDTKGYITAEAKNDLRGIMYQSIFQGGSTRLEEMFNTMPAKAQKAILATAFRDYDSPKSESMIVEIQNSIRAYYALSQSADFMNAKTYKDVRLAVEGWKKQYQIDDATGESYLPAENFSNFALLLATMYKGEKQTLIQGTFNKLYDLIQGTQEADLFETPDNTPRTLSQAIKEVLNIDYNGQQRSNVLVGDTTTSQRGEQGSTRDAATRERTKDGERTADSAGGIEAESRIAQNEQENTKSQGKKPNIRRIGRVIGSSLSTDEFISETMSIVIKDVKTFPKEIRDEDIISKEQKSGKRKAGIKVKVGLLGNDLYIQYRKGRSFANKDKELWEKEKRWYWATIKIPNATNYSAGQLRYRLDYAGTTTDIARIVSDAVLELFNKKELRLHKGSGIGNVSIQEAALRDALIDKLREAGIDVITDVEEAQRLLDEANGKGVSFFRTADGNAYGFTVGGKIYIDPRIATADTPIHEYAHLWASAMQKLNPNEWANIVKLMKGTPIWEEVKRNYPELTTDNEIADEVLAFYSGSRGAERLREEHAKILKGNGNVVEKVKAINAIKRVKEALKRFWKNVAEWFGIHFTTAEEVADKVLSDLLNGVNPTLAGVENDIRFEENSEEADIVARAKADGTYMKAPNGKKSNLSPRQWVQVRTKAFKDWFGDWENDPDNSSKVVDENGEPMVVYHGTTNDETEQKWNEKLKSYDTAHKQFTIFRRNTGGERNYGMFFNSDMDNAFAYGYYTYSVYLNIKNPLEIDCNNSSYDKIRYNGEVKDTYEWAKWAEKNGYDGVIFRNIRDGVDFNSMNEPTNDYVTFDSNQIKSATDNVGTFDKNNPDIRYRRASNRSVISSRFERQAEIQREEKNTKSAANIVLGNANVVLNDTNIFDEQYQNAIDNNLIDENVSPLIDSFGITWGYQLKNGVIVINKDVFVSDILDKRVKDNLSLLISSLMKTNKTFFKEGISFFKKLPIWVLYKNDTKSNEDTIKEIINDILLGNTSIDTNKLELLKQYTVQDMNDILDNATKWFEKFEGISSNMFAGNSISDILDTTLGDLMPKEITTTQEGKRLNWFSKLGIDIRSKLFDSLDWFRVVSDKTKDKTASELYDAMIVHTKRVQGKIDIFDKEYIRPIIDTIQSMLGKDFGNSTLSLDLIQEYFAIKSLLGRTASLYKEKFELYLTNHESKKPPMFDEFKQIYDEITEDEIRQRINEMGEKSSMSILQKVDIDYLMEEVRRTLAAEMFVKQYVYSSANTLNQGLQGEQSLGLINEVTNEPYSELYQLLYSDEQSSQTMHSPIEIIEQADILIDRAGLRNEFDFIGNQIQAILNYVNIERVENGLMSYDTFAKRQLMKDFVNQRGENSSEGNLYEITAKQKANEKMKGKDWFNPNSITSIIAVAQTEIATMEKELLAQRLSYFLTNPNNFDVLSQYGMIIDEKETLNEELSEDERNYIMDKNIVLLYGERHTDKNTKGQVDKKKINILKRNDDGTFTKVTISFDNKFIGLEEFVKFVNNNFKYEELRGISKAVAPFTAWTSRIYTILSPLFPTKNLFKDLMVTPWLPAKELNGKNSQYAIKNFYNVFNNLSFILKMSFTEKSFSKKGFENKLKARSQELFEYYLEYSKQHSIFSIEDQIGALSKENKTLQDIERALSGKENKFIKFTERALLIKFMQHYAELFENLHKFSAYVTLRKLGYGEERSAQIANNATLNYDRSGSIGRQLNAIIPFAKAALGGLYRTNYLLPKYNPKGFLQRVITLAVLGVMQGLMYDPDDDDISEFARKSGMVFGSFLYPLLPEELSIVRPVRALVIVMAGKKSPAYFKQELMESTIDLVPIASDALRGAFSYNPLTNKTEFDVGQLFANTDKMTAFYALAMLASYINENKNSFGKNVLLNEETNTDKTRYGRTKQDYGLYDYLARLYNSILNGVDIDDRAAMSNKIGKNGERLMTIAKEDVEFVINNYIPFGRLYAYTAEIIYDAVNDKRINKGHIPLIGGLFAQKSFGKDYYLVNNIKYELKDFTNDFSQSQIEDIKTNILVKAKNREGLRYKALKDNPNARPRMLDKAKQNMNEAFNVFILDINNFVNDNGDKKIDFTEDEYKFILKSFLDSPIMKKALSIGEDTLNKHTAKRVDRTYTRYKKHNNENIDTDKENMKDAAKNFKKMLYDKSITEEEFNDKLNSLYEPLFQQIKLRAKFAGYSIE